ncbi:hypothetical protein OIU76_028014 [Salix suchowensis]|nr:hypothetical protein OIU76_028014 [Salix suchowensis]
MAIMPQLVSLPHKLSRKQPGSLSDYASRFLLYCFLFAKMNYSVFSLSASPSVFVIVLLLFVQVPSSLSSSSLFTDCSNQFVCGDISTGFPFWGAGRPSACGIPELELKCENNITRMNIDQVAYRVLEIKPEIESLRIAREDYLAGLCPPQLANSTFNPKVFDPVIGYTNLTFIYGCVVTPIVGIPLPGLFTCKINDTDGQNGYIQGGAAGPGDCYGSVFVPVPFTNSPLIWNVTDLEELLKEGFEVRWLVDSAACEECNRSSGVCGINNVTNQTTCYCPDQSSGSKTCALPGSTPIADQSDPSLTGMCLNFSSNRFMNSSPSTA